MKSVKIQHNIRWSIYKTSGTCKSRHCGTTMEAKENGKTRENGEQWKRMYKNRENRENAEMRKNMENAENG